MRLPVILCLLALTVSPIHRISASGGAFDIALSGDVPRVDVRMSVGKTSVSTDVDMVTVFSTRALVERVGKISIPAGESRIIISHLPQRIDKSSVRVSISGGAAASLGGVEVFYERYTPEAIQELKDSIQAIDDRLEELKVEEDGLSTRKQFLQSIAQLGGSQAEGEHLVISPQNLTTTANFLKEQLDELAKGKTKISTERRKLKKRRGELQEMLNRITGGQVGRGYRVEVPIRAKSAAQFTVRVKYIVFGARWTPQYDARYDERKEKVSLTYYGTISQSTGEDWKNTRIVLSTAQPQMGTEPPELSRWILRKLRPMVRKKGVMEMPMAAMGKHAEMSMAEEEFKAEYETSTARISGETVVFEIPRRTTIPADGQDHRVVIAQMELDTKKKFLTVPKLDQKVYLTARCENKSDYLFLPGKVSVFQGNDYVGTQRFDEPIGFGEEFQLAMGPVQTIEVKRERTKEFTEKTGIIGQNRRDFFAYKITVSNNSKSTAPIEVIDQIPVSADEDIKVEDVKFEPQPTRRDKRFEGEVVWEFSLNPGEKREILMQFAVKYPKDITVEGL